MPEEPLQVVVRPDDKVAIPFHGTVAANSSVTLVSKVIRYPFRLQGARFHFALGTNRTLRLKLYISPDDSAPTSEPLTGYNVMDPAGQVDYVVGDDEAVDMPHNLELWTSDRRIKIFAENTDSWEHTVSGYVFVTRLAPRKRD